MSFPPAARIRSPLVGAQQLASFYEARGEFFDRCGRLTPQDLRPLAQSPLFSFVFDDTGVGGSTRILLEILTLLGSGDLSIGRLFEGHVNACLLIRQFAAPTLRRRIATAVSEGQLLGIWCADAAEPLLMIGSDAGLHLTGGKAFASGAGLIPEALVVAQHREGRQMALVPMDGVRIDEAAWQPLGMRASMSFTTDFTGNRIGRGNLVGGPGDYFREPWFTAGCSRFAAVQLGSALAIARIMHRHLRDRGRGGDVHQQERLARIWTALTGARGLLQHAAAVWDNTAGIDGRAGEVILAANTARLAVEDSCKLVLDLAVSSVGLQGMLAPHPLERRVRDLMTYLRQPLPDAAVTSIGAVLFEREQLPW